jgi:hypothetical protein
VGDADGLVLLQKIGGRSKNKVVKKNLRARAYVFATPSKYAIVAPQENFHAPWVETLALPLLSLWSNFGLEDSYEYQFANTRVIVNSGSSSIHADIMLSANCHHSPLSQSLRYLIFVLHVSAIQPNVYRSPPHKDIISNAINIVVKQRKLRKLATVISTIDLFTNQNCKVACTSNVKLLQLIVFKLTSFSACK